jgi:xylose isomerase
MKVTTGNKVYFKGISRIKFEGKDSDNPMAFRYYNPKQRVGKKTMEEHFRFAIAYWHTFCGTGGDPFGPGTKNFPWSTSTDPVQRSLDKMDAAFEFITKIGAPFYCFHDYDLVEEGATLKESEKRMRIIVDVMGHSQFVLQSKIYEWCCHQPRL